MAVFTRYALLYLILINFLPSAVKAQPRRADSLFRLAEAIFNRNPGQAFKPAVTAYRYSRSVGAVTSELKSLYLICLFYWGNNQFSKAGEVAELGVNIAKKHNTDSLKGDFLVMTGLARFYRSEYKGAMQKYEAALPYFNSAMHAKKRATTYLNIGICKKKLGQYQEANKYYFAAVRIQEKLNDQNELASTFNSIGNCFMELKWHKQALQYFHKALSIARKEAIRSKSLNNIGYAWIEQKQPDSAIKYLKQSLHLKRKETNTSGYVLALQNLGSAYTLKHQLDKALPILQSSIRIAKDLEMDEEYVRGCLDIAELYSRQKNFSRSIPYILQSEQKAATIESPELLMKALLLKSQAYGNMHQYAEALHAERHANRLQDSLLNIKQNEAISKLEIQFQTREKTREIRNLNTRAKLDKKILQQQQLSLIALAITLLLLTILLIVTIKSYRTKNADNKRIKSLMHEVHHRVKNNLQMLSGLFTIQLAESEDEKIRISIRENEARLNSMNLIHQQLYGVNAGTTINIKEYLGQLVTHLSITFGASDKNIRVIADTEEHLIDADKAVPLGLIVNELVTNSFKYAFGPEGGTILVQFKRSKNQAFELIVKDNGKGAARNAKTAATEGFGLRLVSMMAQQLHAVLETDRSAGFTSIIKF